MPTLYVENVPEDVYAALQKRAAENRTSIAAEVIEMLQFYVPTEKELARRQAAFKQMLRIRSRPTPAGAKHISVEEMLREDRNR